MVMISVSTVMVPGVTAERRSVSTSALKYFEDHRDLTIDEFLTRLRPIPIDGRERARVLAALPPHGAIRAGANELAKMSLAEEVLAYHHRRGLIPFTIIDVAPAFIGLHERAVILVSTSALSLVKNEEFAALVAHEIGHEFVWTDYQLAVERRDHARIRELELRCDGIAVLTLRRLGVDAERLVSAVEKLTWYNQQRRLDADRSDYVSRDDRRAFIHAIEKLQWADSESPGQAMGAKTPSLTADRARGLTPRTAFERFVEFSSHCRAVPRRSRCTTPTARRRKSKRGFSTWMDSQTGQTCCVFERKG
jgi:hypothetical protein